MARRDPQFNVRIPAELKQAIEDAAKENNRSINSEIVYRLQQSFDVNKYISDNPLNLRDPEIDKASISISHNSELPANEAPNLIPKNSNWSKRDIDKFKDSVNHMMKMLKIMNDDLQSEQSESADESNKDVKSKISTKYSG
jgi:predicted HicB family RNase H-like nuclease